LFFFSILCLYLISCICPFQWSCPVVCCCRTFRSILKLSSQKVQCCLRFKKKMFFRLVWFFRLLSCFVSSIVFFPFCMFLLVVVLPLGVVRLSSLLLLPWCVLLFLCVVCYCSFAFFPGCSDPLVLVSSCFRPLFCPGAPFLRNQGGVWCFS
jgi:hypothetical protein